MLVEGVKADEADAVDATSAPRLLVIDDDNLHRMIVCRVAAKVGYIPIGGATYEESVKLTQESAFDCITLDLSRGEHAGVEILRHLAGIDCKAPIIIISGCDDATFRETMRLGKSLKLNICEPVRKPVDLTILRYTLERLRGQRTGALASS
jgi:DNA-binding NtrC family response regulator